MSQGREPTTPEVVSDATSDRAADAFALLSDETRLGIMLALWDAYEPFEDDTAVSFSTLRERVGMQDSGQFNYHLGELTGQYVDATEDGYELREAGHRIIQSVLAGVGVEDPSFGPITPEPSVSCPTCGTPVRFEYRDWKIKGYCPECPSRADSSSDGRLVMNNSFEPAGVADRPVEDTLVADHIQTTRHMQMRLAGVCQRCSGQVETWFDVCEEHTAPEDGRCEACGRASRVQLRTECSVCKSSSYFPGENAIAAHPRARVFLIDHGYPYGFAADRTPSVEEFVALDQSLTTVSEVTSTEPFRYEVTTTHESGDELQVVFNDDVEVIDVTQEDPTTA